MTNLLIFFALPIAIIIISIALQKLFKCPFLVAAIIFAIFLVVTFAVGNLNLLVATIAYTIIAFITAFLTMWFCRLIDELNLRNRNSDNNRNRNSGEGCCCGNNSRTSNNNTTNDSNLLTISCGCNGTQNDLLTINSTCSSNNNSDCGCGNNNTDNNSIAVRASVFPNNNGRSGSFSGCFRRR